MKSNHKKGITVVNRSVTTGVCRTVYKGNWFQLHWTEDWAAVTITINELLAVVIAAAVWGLSLVVNFQCDNGGCSVRDVMKYWQ